MFSNGLSQTSIPIRPATTGGSQTPISTPQPTNGGSQPQTTSNNSQPAAPSTTPSTGTKNAKFVEHRVRVEGTQRDPNTFDSYQTITADYRYRNFSQEELRVADYAQGNKPQANAVGGNLFPTRRGQHAHYLQLLRGPSIEIVVGPEDTSFTSTCHREMWGLPKALLSHHSPFLKSACALDFKEREENCIKLPEDDPKIFSLFVEWLYHGEYTPVQPYMTNLGDFSDVDAQAWVLGDKLMCPNFKNYAMRRIYGRHTASVFSSPVRTQDVAYVCENTMEGGALRRFYLDFVATYFTNSCRVVGSTEEWDEVLQDHADARTFLLSGFRTEPTKRSYVKDMEAYLEKEEADCSSEVEGTGS